MSWMMSLGLLGWVLVFALVVTLVVVVIRWLDPPRDAARGREGHGPYDKPS